MRPGSIYPIHVVSLLYMCSIQNAEDIIDKNICDSVYVLHLLGKMTE